MLISIFLLSFNSCRSIWIPMLWVYNNYKDFTGSLRESTLDFWRICPKRVSTLKVVNQLSFAILTYNKKYFCKTSLTADRNYRRSNIADTPPFPRATQKARRHAGPGTVALAKPINTTVPNQRINCICVELNKGRHGWVARHIWTTSVHELKNLPACTPAMPHYLVSATCYYFILYANDVALGTCMI